MTLLGGFTRADAASRFAAQSQADGEPPPYHDADEEGGWRVNVQRVSAQMSPRDKCSPPDPELVDRIVEMYIATVGGDRSSVRRVVNALYAAAEDAADQRLRVRKAPDQETTELRKRLRQFKSDLTQERRRGRLLKQELDSTLERYRLGIASKDAQVQSLEQKLQDSQALYASDLEALRQRERQLQILLKETIVQHRQDMAAKEAEVAALAAQVIDQRIRADRLERTKLRLVAENDRLAARLVSQREISVWDRDLENLLSEQEAIQNQLVAVGSVVGANTSARVQPRLPTTRPSTVQRPRGPQPDGDDPLVPITRDPWYMPPEVVEKSAAPFMIFVVTLLVAAIVTFAILVHR